MSATYNWAYKPGVANKYGIIIAASADNVKPANAAYVALFGNDITGNGSRQYPFRTITKGLGNGLSTIIGSGVYREAVSANNTLIGDGDVVIDNSFISNLSTGVSCTYLNIKVRTTSPLSMVLNRLTDCIINPFTILQFAAGLGIRSTVFDFGSIANLSTPTTVDAGVPSQSTGNNTFVNAVDLQINTNGNSGVYWNCIYDNCNISINNTNSNIDYSLFHNCRFRCGNSGAYTAINDLPTLLTFLRATFPNIAGFTHCAFGDPLFNNPTIGDFSLQFGSPAKNLSYFGTYVGARSIAYPIKASATEATGGFDLSTNINLIIANDSITLSNPALDGEIKTQLIVNPSGRQISKLPIYGFNADRNGQYVDSIQDLDTAYKNAGDTLAVPVSYLVETGALTYNGNVYQPGDRLTTVSGVTVFTTTAGGTLREILEAPQRHTIMARFSDSVNTISAGTAVTVGYWYYVQNGSVTYNGTVYSAGQSFKGVDSNAFTGTGVVIVALSTESYQHYETGSQPTSNNTGDTRTGSIIRGNGDPAYVRGGMGVTEFPINAKFIQIRYIIKANNLKP